MRPSKGRSISRIRKIAVRWIKHALIGIIALVVIAIGGIFAFVQWEAHERYLNYELPRSKVQIFVPGPTEANVKQKEEYKQFCKDPKYPIPVRIQNNSDRVVNKIDFNFIAKIEGRSSDLRRRARER
jgi:hypothetical protein